MMRAVPVVGLLVALAGTPIAAQQQEDKLEPPELGSYRRWGFLRARPGIELSNLGYDSNILSTSTGQPVSDITATLSPKLDGLILFGSKAFITLREQFDYTFYAEHSDQNFWNNSFTARATVPFRSFGVFGQGSLDDLRWRPFDQEDIRIKSRRREIGVGVILQPGWGTEIELARYANRWRYEDPQAPSMAGTVDERLDRNEAWTTLDLSYQLRGRTRALLRVENRQIEFLSPFDTGTGALIERDSEEWRTLAGFRLGRGSSLVGHMLVGWGRIDAQDPLLPDLSELIGELDTTWIVGSHTRVRLVAERSPGFAVTDSCDATTCVPTTYYLRTFGLIRTVHYFTNLFGGEFAVRRGRLDFPEVGVGTTRQDDIRHYEVGVRLRLRSAADGRRVEYKLTVGRYRRDSNIAGFDQDKTTFGFSALLGF